MRPVITPEESRRLDAVTEVPEPVLLDRAGLAVALGAARLGARYGARVLVLAGPGNNGGDGYVAAHRLRERGADVAVRSLGYPRGDGSPRRAAAISAVADGVPVAPIGDPEPCDLLIDALFGSGFRGSLPDAVVPWTELGVPVLAVDVPSGLDGTTGDAPGAAFRAEATVTFQAVKTGHLVGRGPELSGRIEVADIGLGEVRPEWLECSDEDATVPLRPRDAHKWSAGSVAIVGGSDGLLGAPMLAGASALAFGAGAVRVAVPGALGLAAAAMDPGVMVSGIGEADRFGAGDVPALLDAVARFDCLVIGPGLGNAAGVARGVLDGHEGPVVIDADALQPEIMDAVVGRSAPSVITPHAAEFARLSGGAATPVAAAAMAEEAGAVVLLKGAPTFVMGRERWVVTSGTAALATIGTGDVLAGMIGALIARGLEPEAAARAAAHRHGRAGRALQAVTTVTATELSREIGRWAW